MEQFSFPVCFLKIEHISLFYEYQNASVSCAQNINNEHCKFLFLRISFGFEGVLSIAYVIPAEYIMVSHRKICRWSASWTPESFQWWWRTRRNVMKNHDDVWCNFYSIFFFVCLASSCQKWWNEIRKFEISIHVKLLCRWYLCWHTMIYNCAINKKTMHINECPYFGIEKKNPETMYDWYAIKFNECMS